MASNQHLTGIILAAGTSSRMGVNKLLLPRPRRPLVRTVCERIVAAGIEQIVVVLGHEQSRIEPELAGLPLSTTFNPNYRDGIATSVAAGVVAASSSSTGYLIALADMPEIRVETYRLLSQVFESAAPDAIVVPTYRGERGNPVIFARSYRCQLLGLQGDEGARHLLKTHERLVTRMEIDDPGVRLDIDEPGHL